ncbi:hypothetical protein MTO96_005589 [Rhipicephalus appendiculatus]
MPDNCDQQLLVIDTDPGVDDALAIMLALSSPCKVLAFTCVSGNVELPLVYTNLMRILNYCGKLEIPVYQGCRKPLVTSPMNAVCIHGKDGLGGVSERYPLPADGTFERQSEHASQALVSLARKHAGALTLVALAPLTNLAVASRLDPEFFANLKQLVIMGGTCDGIGNVTASGEFNFVCDPEATRVVLTEASEKIQLVPYETCIRHYLDWDWCTNWVNMNTHKSRMVRDVSEGHDAAPAGHAQAARFLVLRPAGHGHSGEPRRGAQDRGVPGMARTARHEHARHAHRRQAARHERHQA